MIVADIRSGSPLPVYNLNGGCQSFGEANCAAGRNEDGAVLAAPWTGGTSAHYNVTVPTSVSANPNSAGVNSNYANGGDGINLFSDPAATFAQFRPCILGYDTSCGTNGQIRGMPTWNVDMTVSKDIAFWKEGRVSDLPICQPIQSHAVKRSVPGHRRPAGLGRPGAPNGGSNYGGPPLQQSTKHGVRTADSLVVFNSSIN